MITDAKLTDPQSRRRSLPLRHHVLDPSPSPSNFFLNLSFSLPISSYLSTLKPMAVALYGQAARTNRVQGIGDDLVSVMRSRKFSGKLVLNGFGSEMASIRKKSLLSYSIITMCVKHTSESHASLIDPIVSIWQSKNDDALKITDESALILIRHGESMWNEKNLFTGCVDVPLTSKGVEEAIEAGKRISSIPIDIIYISALVRSQMTAMLALTQHCCQKVPIIMHNESDKARLWSQICSEETKDQSIPVVKAWQLNERMYGDLQGYNKQETAEVYGKEQVYKWRRSYEVRPPNGESLEMCLQRAVTYFKEHIEPQLLARKHVMVVAHANSLRSIIMYLDKLTPQEVINLELSTGVPMLYIYKDGEFIRRGSPTGPAEAGVYAYTWNLALHKKKLEMLQ